MKKLQGPVLNIVLGTILLFGLPFQSHADPATDSVVAPFSRGTASGKLALADSLFRRKQYTQSLELYEEIFKNKYYTPNILLKLAFIQEGLGHLGQSMYYLNLYFLSTHDPQALVKIEEVAAHNKLEGYGDTDAARLWTLMKENHEEVVGSLVALCAFLFALMFYQKVKLKRRPVVTAVVLLFFLLLLFIQFYLVRYKDQGIIATPSTYLMSGPSAGSSVVAIVGEGHRLEILGKKDVWLRVKWINEEVYVKQDALLAVRL